MMPAADALVELDWHAIGCQCDQHTCTSVGGCRNTATEHVEFHALDHCNESPTCDGETLNPFGNYVFLLCLDCLQALACVVADELRQRPPDGRGYQTCATCGAPAAELSDVIREVKTL